MALLFKFCSGDGAIAILKGNSIFVTSPLDLNDPFEMRPAWTDEHEARHREDEQRRNAMLNGMPVFAAMKGHRLVPMGPMPQLRATPPMDVDHQRGIADEHNRVVFERLHKRFRVLSLVQPLFDIQGEDGGESDENATLMWSHYGDQFQGICLALDDSQFCNGIQKGGYKVEYTPERQSLAPSEYDTYLALTQEVLTSGHCLDQGTQLWLPADEIAAQKRQRMLRFLTHKSPAWQYEREVRMIYELPEFYQSPDYQCLSFPCKEGNFSVDQSSYRDAVKLPPLVIRAVIFGTDCLRPTVEKIAEILDAPCYSHVAWYWSALHSSRYAVQYIRADKNYVSFIQDHRSQVVALVKNHVTNTGQGLKYQIAPKGMNFYHGS